MLFKLNFEQAYNRVNKNILYRVMEEKGFGINRINGLQFVEVLQGLQWWS